MGEAIRAKINEDFNTYGLQVTKFYVENISLPPEVEAAMDKRASMGAIGSVDQYMKFQAADALRDAAQNEGGGAGLGASLGAGFAVGNQMANAFGGDSNGGGQSQALSVLLAEKRIRLVRNSATKRRKEVAKVPCVKCGAECAKAQSLFRLRIVQEKQNHKRQAELAAGQNSAQCVTKTERNYRLVRTVCVADVLEWKR